jgi:hypothetical protein
MSVVIIGGNERMERVYTELCHEHGYRAKVFTKASGDISKKVGSADLFVLFTNTVSHNLVQTALKEARRCSAEVERCHSSSLSALKTILQERGARAAC